MVVRSRSRVGKWFSLGLPKLCDMVSRNIAETWPWLVRMPIGGVRTTRLDKVRPWLAVGGHMDRWFAPVLRRAFVALPLFALGTAASAQQPTPWQLGFQEPATEFARKADAFHDGLLVLIFAIAIFVLLLLLYTMWRFRASANPNPTKTTHNTVVEILWSVIPIFILLGVARFSFPLLFLSDAVAESQMTIKAIGRQWYWTYEYPDHGDFVFDAFIVEDDDLQEGQPRLLATDNNVVVPVNTKIRLLVTSSDVLHAWAVPSFAIKMDAVPGRTNEIWFEAEKTGVFYGQCSELCGAGHGYMPIAVEVVSQEEFDAWVVQAQEQFARADDTLLDQKPVRVAEIQFPHQGAE